jgi:glycosyltransferase involved in cell wall biosynthesis
MVTHANGNAFPGVTEPTEMIARGDTTRAARPRTRVAVVSLFLDKGHGSERVMIEWLAHLPDSFDIHIYSQHVEDLESTKFVLHRSPKLPGPHLFNFLWWLAASRVLLNWDRRFRNLNYDLIFSSGAEWPGADAICVHVVFAEYVRRAEESMKLLRNPPQQWPRILHRKLYYRLAEFLERSAHTNPDTTLVAYSRKTGAEIERFYGPRKQLPVIHLGIDHDVFNPIRRATLRTEARTSLQIPEGEFAVLIVGNDWRNKGVPALLDALTRLHSLPVSLMIVSREDLSACRDAVHKDGLDDRVRFLPPRRDIEFYYAAADAYAGPSLQDSYSMPPAEAMACGMPVIVSASAGVSEIVTHEIDGLILDDPSDGEKLASMIQQLYEDREFREGLGARAHQMAQQYTWESNGRKLAAIFEDILRRKSAPVSKAERAKDV